MYITFTTTTKLRILIFKLSNHFKWPLVKICAHLSAQRSRIYFEASFGKILFRGNTVFPWLLMGFFLALIERGYETAAALIKVFFGILPDVSLIKNWYPLNVNVQIYARQTSNNGNKIRNNFFHIFDRFCVLGLWEMAVSIKVHKLLKLKIIIVKVGEPVFARPPPRRSVSRTSTMYVHQCFSCLFIFIYVHQCLFINLFN